MKGLSTLFILFLFIHETGTAEMNPFKFRKKMLEQFNYARRIIASGDVAKILEVASFIEPLNRVRKVFGPAANMYKLVWNRQLEKAAFDYVDENGLKIGKIGRTLFHKDYIGFHWVGDIFSVVRAMFDLLPGDFLSRLKAYEDLIETVVIILWMGISMPYIYPVKEGEYYGAGELVTALRHEIGCYSNIAISICFMKKVPYQPTPFLRGAACSSCTTHCEFFTDSDGESIEGELCVPPEGYYNDQKAEAALLENFSIGVSVLPVAVLILILSIR